MFNLKLPFLGGSRNYLDTLKTTLFIGITALVMIAAARNTLTWHLQQFWGASADFWEALWGKFCDFFGNDEQTLAVFGTIIVTTVFFWTINAMFIAIDLLQWPSIVLRYKIQPTQSFSMADFWKAVRVALFNQICVGGLCMYVAYPIMKWRGCSFGSELPTFHYVLGEFIVFALVEEVGFYYSHRLAHHGLFYKYIHKKHHEWTAPIGIVCIYAHPIEHILSNTAPIIAGPLLTGAHLGTMWLWFAIAIASTTVSHCGYHLPFLPSPEAHDFHHLKFINCFGVLGILDRLHNTDNLFRNSKNYQRHYLFFSMTPPRVLIPDETKTKVAATAGELEAKKVE